MSQCFNGLKKLLEDGISPDLTVGSPQLVVCPRHVNKSDPNK